MERAKESNQQSKPQFLRLRKGLPETKKKIQNIVLFNRNIVQQFNVFADKEVGFGKEFSKHIIRNKQDQDYESSDEIVEFGTKKCQKILKTKLKYLSKQAKEPEDDDSEQETESAYPSEPESQTECSK